MTVLNTDTTTDSTDITTEKRAALMEARFDLGDQSVEDIWRNVDASQKRARRRTLDRQDVELFIRNVCDLISLCCDKGVPPAQIVVVVNGGGVANSYGYRAEDTPKTERRGIVRGNLSTKEMRAKGFRHVGGGLWLPA